MKSSCTPAVQYSPYTTVKTITVLIIQLFYGDCTAVVVQRLYTCTDVWRLYRGCCDVGQLIIPVQFYSVPTGVYILTNVVILLSCCTDGSGCTENEQLMWFCWKYYCNTNYFRSTATSNVLKYTVPNLVCSFKCPEFCVYLVLFQSIRHSIKFYIKCTLYSVHSCVYTIHCDIQHLQCKVYQIQITVCNVLCTLHTVKCNMHTVHYTCYTLHCTLKIYIIQIPMYTIQYTCYTLQYTV